MFTQIHPHLAMTSMTSSDLWKAEISQFPKSPSPSGAISMKVFFTVTFTSAPGGRPVLSHGEKLKNGPPHLKFDGLTENSLIVQNLQMVFPLKSPFYKITQVIVSCFYH